jgi:hypothetical protein
MEEKTMLKKINKSAKSLLVVLLAVVTVVLAIPQNSARAQVIGPTGGIPIPVSDIPEALRPTEVQATLSPDITITLDGKKLDLLNVNGAEVAPILYNGTTMVPARGLSYAFGKLIKLETASTGVQIWEKREWYKPGMHIQAIKIYTDSEKYPIVEDIYIDNKLHTRTGVPEITSRITDKTPKTITALSDPAAYVALCNAGTFYIGLKDALGNRVYPLLYEGTYYIPLRATAPIFGCSVAWDGDNRTVILTTTSEVLLFAGEEYVSSRYPTEEEKAVFDTVSDNTERTERYLEWLNANTDAIVKYTTSYYGGWINGSDPLRSSYGNDDFVTYGNGYENYGSYASFGHPPWYESEQIEALAKSLVGKTDRETQQNIYFVASSMLYADGYSPDGSLAMLNGTQPYSQDCVGGTNLLIALLKAVGMPAVMVHESANRPHHAYLASYIADEKTWVFSDWMAVTYYVNGEPKGFDLGVTPREPATVEIAGIPFTHPLEVSYWLNHMV